MRGADVTSVDTEGKPVHEGDMRVQMIPALDNLEEVLKRAEFSLSNVVRLNYYTTNVDQMFENWDVIANRLTQAECRPTSTLLGVSRLAFPKFLVEIEATAVK